MLHQAVSLFLVDPTERQRMYGDDVPWVEGDEAVKQFLEEQAAHLGITVDQARKVAEYARGGSKDSYDFTFHQAHMGLEMGLI
jgi:hypothetical protein